MDHDKAAHRAMLLQEAEDSRIRALYHPTRVQQLAELEKADRLTNHAHSESIFGSI